MVKNKKKIKLKVRVHKEEKDTLRQASADAKAMADRQGERKDITASQPKIDLDDGRHDFVVNKVNNKKKENIFFSQEEKSEHDKKIMMWAGVSFFMILFVVLWIANMKNVFKQVEQGRDNSKQFEWNQITDEFNQTMGQIKESLNGLKQVVTIDNISSSTEGNINNYLPKNENASTTLDITNGAGKEQDISELKDRLKNLENSLNNKN